MYVKTDGGKIGTGIAHVFCSPAHPSKGGTYRLVLRQHGAGSSYKEAMALAARYGLLTRGLTDAGLAVLFVDASDLPSGGWGNDAAITRLGDAWTWAKANLPIKTDKVLLLGQSAGNVWGMNWARQNISQVGAIASIIGVFDVQDVRDNNRQSLATGIDLAYSGVSGTPPTNGQYLTHSPVQYAAEIATIPQKHYYSTDDNVAIPTALDTYLTAAGLDASHKASFGTVGHSIGPGLGTPSLWTDPSAFLAQYL